MNAETVTPVWHYDAGHGWLKVPLSSVHFSVSTYSYLDTKFAYLEEDCDAVAWIESTKNLYGDPTSWLEVNDGDRSWIRNLNNFGGKHE